LDVEYGLFFKLCGGFDLDIHFVMSLWFPCIVGQNVIISNFGDFG